MEDFLNVRQAYNILKDAELMNKHAEDLRPFDLGESIVIQGLSLSCDPELNGSFGIVLAWDGRRVEVGFTDGWTLDMKKKLVHPAQLLRCAAPRAAYRRVSDTSSAETQWSQGSGIGCNSSSSAGVSALPGKQFSSWPISPESDPQEGEEIRVHPSGGMWPFCMLCSRFSDESHRATKKHVDNLARARPAGMPPPSPFGPAAAVLKYPKKFPSIPNFGWTPAEIGRARFLVDNHPRAPMCGPDIYTEVAAARGNLFVEEGENQLLASMRILQCSFYRLGQISEDVLKLKQRLVTDGKKAMEKEVITYDWNSASAEGTAWYVKTAGDMLQCNWSFEQSLDYRFHFFYNTCQSSFMKWGHLEYCLFHSGSAPDTFTNDHVVADLCETITLYLPSPLLHLYLQCMANFHKLYFSHMSLPSCEFVGARAQCFKRRVSGSNFCRRHIDIKAKD
jgi:hypothetical protein